MYRVGAHFDTADGMRYECEIQQADVRQSEVRHDEVRTVEVRQVVNLYQFGKSMFGQWKFGKVMRSKFNFGKLSICIGMSKFDCSLRVKDTRRRRTFF